MMKLNMMTRVALMTALTVVGSAVKIPFGAMPITLNTFFAALSGMLLGAAGGAWAQGLFMLIGLCGVPVFTFGGGPSSVLQPSFGYIVGYILCAWTCGTVLKKGVAPRRAAWAAAAGIGAIYSVGVPWLWCVANGVMNVEMSFAGALYAGFAVFLPGEILKGAALVFIVCKVHSHILHDKVQ